MARHPDCVPYRLELRGPLPRTVESDVAARFSDVSIVAQPDRTTVVLSADQAALRSLLSLLWDSGVEVLEVVAEGVRG